MPIILEETAELPEIHSPAVRLTSTKNPMLSTPCLKKGLSQEPLFLISAPNATDVNFEIQARGHTKAPLYLMNASSLPNVHQVENKEYCSFSNLAKCKIFASECYRFRQLLIHS
jgi:hypothetical protein